MHGGPTESIETDGGQVRSFARLQKETEALHGNAALNAAKAEAALDSINTTGKVFDTAPLGIIGTTEAQTFAVLADDLQSWSVYKNNAGVAQWKSSAYTKAYIDSRINASSKRYLFRRLLSHVWSSADGKKAAMGITADDGTLLARLAITPASEISFVRNAATGFYTLGLGVVRSFAFQNGSVNATMTRYFARRKVLHLRSAAGGALGDAITDDGYHRAKHAIMPGKGIATTFDPRRGETTLSWGTAAEDRTLGGGNIVSTACKRFFNRELLTHLLSGGGRTGLAIGISGTAYIPKPYLPPVISPGSVALGGGVMVRSQKVAGRFQLIRTLASGAQALLTTVGNNGNPVIEGANVLYLSDRGTRFPLLAADMYWQPVAGGGVEKRVFPLRTAWLGIGDSLSQTSYQPYLAALLGLPVVARGIGGQGGKMIAMRQGGLPVYLTLTGNTVSAGANTITAINGTATGGAIGDATSPLFLSSPASNEAFSAAGWLVLGANRVHGTVVRTGTGGLPSTAENYSFTPSTNIALPLACPAGTLFELEEALLYADYPQIIWSCTNDVLLWPTSTAPSLAVIAAMVARVNPLRPWFILPSPTIISTFLAGTVYHNAFDAFRAQLAALYPNNYLDIHNLLVTQGHERLGLVPTANDLIDRANDVVPRGLRADDIHPNELGRNAVALFYFDFITAKGWNLNV